MKPRLEIRFDKELRLAFKRREPLYMPRDNEFLLNHARCGLLLALQALNLPEGSGVGVMVYNCHTLMNAVVQAGYKPIFVDVNDDLKLDLEDLQKKSSQMKALIVTHLFGLVNEIDAIRRCFPQLVIIEDCAHFYGKPIEGDFGVYSIGPGKLPSLGDGGVLVVKNVAFQESVKTIYNALPDYASRNEKKLYVKLRLMSIAQHRWLYGWLTRPWKQLRRPQSGKETIVMKKMSTGVQAMLGLRKEAVRAMVEQRKENARKEMEQLVDNPVVLKILLGENAFMLPVLTTDPEALKKQYARHGVETATHFANSIRWASEFGYQGECPNTEILIKELLMVPTYK